MARNWSHTNLGQVAEWSSGTTPSKARHDYWNGDIPWVSPKDMKRFELHDTQDHISQRAVDAGAKLVPSDTVFVVVRGMILAHTFPVCIAQRAMSFNQDVKALAPRQGTNGRFLAHWLQGRADKLLRIVTEATHGTKRIELRDIQGTSLELPQLEEQQRIAEILDTLDEAIRKTEQIIAKLKQMKQGLLHDLLTHGIDDHGELRNAIRHPEQFKDTALGRIPIGWDLEKLVALVEEHQAGIYKDRSLYGSGDNIVGVADLFRHESIDGQMFRRVQLTDAERGKYSLRAGDLVYAESSLVLDGIAKTLAVTERGAGTGFAWHTRRLSLRKKRVDAQFLALALGMPTARRFVASRATQTAITGIPVAEYLQTPVSIPPFSVQHHIVTLVRAHDARTERECALADKLIVLKHGLMEDLLTGKVRVDKMANSAREKRQLGLPL